MTNIALRLHENGKVNVGNIRLTFWRFLALYVILFGMEFDIDITGPISLKKIAFLAVMIFIARIGIPRELPIYKESVLFGLGLIVLLFYAYIICQTHVENLLIPGNQPYSPIQIFFQFLTFYIFPVLLAQIFTNPQEFLRVQMAVIVTQVLVTIISRISEPFRMLIYYRFVPDDGRLLSEMEAGTRVGIIGSAGATGSWIMFIGCIICAYYVLTTRKTRYLYLYGLILVSMAFIGRTGLYFGIALLFFLFVFLLSQSIRMSFVILCFGFGGIVGIICYLLFVPDSYVKQATIQWLGEIILKGFGEGSTFQILVDMGAPPLTWETLWGTGIVYGTTVSGITSVSDVGYFHSLMLYGLFGAILYYGWAYGFFAHAIHSVKDRYVRWSTMAFLFFMIIAEFKEPFLRKTPVYMIMITFLFLQRKIEKKEVEKANA